MIETLENIKSLEMDINLLQQTLIQTKRKLKLYEKLKEKKLNEYLQEEILKEKHAFDEFSQIQHFFKCHS
jgi:flagellar export protein FliJ